MSLDLTGLDAIAAGLEDVANGGVKRVALSHITPDPAQPRKTYNAQALAELAASVRAHGVIQPIVVKQRIGGGFVLISGERRWRAAKLAGLTDIPVVVRDDLDAFAQMVENIQREDLTPAEIYQWLATQIEAGRPKGELADKLGKSNAWVSAYALVAKMPEAFQVALTSGLAADITALGHLFKLWKREPAAAERLLHAGEPITRHNVAALAEKLATKPKPAPLPTTRDATETDAVADAQLASPIDGDEDSPALPCHRASTLPVRMIASYENQAWAVIYTDQTNDGDGVKVLLANEGGMEIYAPLSELRLTAIIAG